MPIFTGTNPYDEVDALAAGLTTCLSPNPIPGDTRTIVVRGRPYTKVWTGGYPLVAAIDDRFRLDREVPSFKGQSESRPSVYRVDVMDAVPQRSADPEAEGKTTSNVLYLVGTILAYFDTEAGQCLSGAVFRAGEHIEVLRNADYAVTSDQDLVISRTMFISIQGLKRRDIRP